MKKIIVSAWVFLLWCLNVFAYTPSAELVEKMDLVVAKFEIIIDTKWEGYRWSVLNAIEIYQKRYEWDERISYILWYLYDNLSEADTTSASGVSNSTISWAYSWEYTISDSTYGTEVAVTISWDTRTITSNALANHEVGTFPNKANPNTISEQDKRWELDLTPTYTWNATWAHDSWVAYNGVKYQLETAERLECASGEVYRIEAQQTVIDVIGLDFNNAHVQPTWEYHYHWVSDLLMETLEWDDVVHVWYATDGFPLFYSKQWSYTPSYQLVGDTRTGTNCIYRDSEIPVEGTTPDGTYDRDWEFVAWLWNLDSCNGAYVDDQYGYFITEDFPFGPRCMNGETSTKTWPGGWAQWWPGWRSGPWTNRTWAPTR